MDNTDPNENSNSEDENSTQTLSSLPLSMQYTISGKTLKAKCDEMKIKVDSKKTISYLTGAMEYLATDISVAIINQLRKTHNDEKDEKPLVRPDLVFMSIQEDQDLMDIFKGSFICYQKGRRCRVSNY